MEKNIFEKIRDNESPANIVYKDEYVTAFDDIKPDAPVHILLIPNKMIKSLNNIEDEDSVYLTKILYVAKDLAKKYNINESGYRLLFNTNSDAMQTVFHIHLHLIGGEKLKNI